jgi:predicted nucleotide-binding protein (sugar kinase/HSP70/actin superfamily)
VLERLFDEDVRAGVVKSPLEIQDVWKNSYSASTNHKVWAAKFTARHPNLVALELSSFKCGHDAPIYTTIESIIERSGTPYFSFKDVDENKPTGSIRIRVETIHYFLKRYAEHMNKPASAEIERQVAEYERRLREQLLRESEFAELGSRQRETIVPRKLLPIVGQAGASQNAAVH